MTPRATSEDSTLVHQTLFFESVEQQADAFTPLLTAALRDGQAVTAVLDAPVVEALGQRMGDDLDQVSVRSPTECFHYPGQAMRDVEQLARESTARGSRGLIVGEPRFEHDGMDEDLWLQVEAAYTAVLADAPITMICSYNTQERSDALLAGARCTHDQIREGGRLHRSTDYLDLPDYLAAHPVAAPSAPAPEQTWSVRSPLDAANMRRQVHGWATAGGLRTERAVDLTVAVNELVTNAIVHGSDVGSVSWWRGPQELVVEVTNPGEPEDDYLGLAPPSRLSPDGRGLWMTRRLCDSVYVWPQDGGTHVRVEMALDTSGTP